MDLVVRVHGEHTEGSVGVIAAAVHAAGNIVEVEEPVSAGGQVSAHIVRQPQSAEDIHERFSRVPGDVQFGDKHGQVRW